MFELLGKVRGLLWQSGLFLGGVLLILFKVRQSGKEAEQHKEMRETLKGVKESAEIENNVASLKSDKLEQLRQRFNRD